jgi:hypothetical protein
MRARQRHFNARDLGANLVLDARYINQSNDTAISSWSDRSRFSNNATQSTPANQPTFKTNILNGNSGVNFNLHFINFSSINILTAFILFKASSDQNLYASVFGNVTTYINPQLFNTSFRWIETAFTGNGFKNGTWRNNFSTFTPTTINSLTTNADIVSCVLSESATINSTSDRGVSTRRPKGDIHQYCLFDSALSVSALKKLTHSTAFSFKIACN